MIPLIERAAMLARTAHAGQQDKAGRDYFAGHLTPIAAASVVFGSDAVTAAAWLHDIVEDTAITLADLQGFPDVVVGGVDAVTRRDDETYPQLIDRSVAHPVGRRVKLLDNGWNVICNPDLALVDPVRADSLLNRRYKPAQARLLTACGLDLESPQVVQMFAILDTHRRRLAGT